MTYKMNALLLTATGRQSHVEQGVANIDRQVRDNKETLDSQYTISQQITTTAENIGKGTLAGRTIYNKPINEFKAIQQVVCFDGSRSKFWEWNEKLINAMAQVNPGYRGALENLNVNL